VNAVNDPERWPPATAAALARIARHLERNGHHDELDGMDVVDRLDHIIARLDQHLADRGITETEAA
jgi:hypothetical protein